MEVVIQGLETASLGSSDGEEGGGWGSIAPGGGWDSSGSEYGDIANEDFPDFSGGDVGGGVAAAPEHPCHLRDVSRPTAVAAGQAIECRLPARPDCRDSNAVPVEFVVHVPGFETVTGVRVGGRGARAYPLSTTVTARESAANRKARGVAERFKRAAGRDAAQKNKMGLALVVDVGEKTSGAAGVGSAGEMRRRSTQNDGADQELTALSSSSRGGLVAELRTNVCVHNSSASDVEIDMAEMASAAAAIAKTPGATRPINQSRQQDWEAAPGAAGDGSATVVRLAAGARLSLPLSVLSSWQLRIAGDSTSAWSRPLRLSPALLDPAVPNALRLTSGMERNSLCLRLTKSSGRVLSSSGGGSSSSAAGAAAAAAARGEVYPHESNGGHTQSLPPSEQGGGDGLRNKSSKSVGFNLHSPRSSKATTSSWVEGTTTTSLPSRLPPPGGVAATGSAQSSPSTADWVLIVQPSYLVTNALPCAMEVEVLQPPLSSAGSGGGARTERSRSWAGNQFSAVGPAGEADAPGGERWRDATPNVSSDDDSDAESVASSVTSRQTTQQQREGKGRAMASASASANATDRAEAPIKAAVRNPALDLFFLPSASNSVAEVASTSGSRGGGRARSDSRGDTSGDGGGGFDGRVRSGSGVYAGGGRGTGGGGAESGNASYDPEGGSRKQGGRLLQDLQQREEHDAILELDSVWKGLVGSGQEAKVKPTYSHTVRGRRRDAFLEQQMQWGTRDKHPYQVARTFCLPVGAAPPGNAVNLTRACKQIF